MILTAMVLGILAGLVVSFFVIIAPAYHIFGRSSGGGSRNFVIDVSPKSLSVARGGSGRLIVTFSPPEYGSFLSPVITVAEEGFGEIDGYASPINQNSFAYDFDIENDAPLGTYTATLTVSTYVPSPPLAASENFMLTIT
jgi:hypothetical protein